MKKPWIRLLNNLLNVWEDLKAKEGWTLACEDPSQFTRSQWDSSSDPSVIYLLYRCFTALFLLVWWLIVFCNTGHDILGNGFSWEIKGYWFIYLTNWGYTILTIASILQASIVLNRFYKARKLEPAPLRGSVKMPVVWKCSWVLENCANASAILITMVYWTLLHRQMSIPLGASTVHVHLINTIYVLFNIMITAHPVRPKHVYQPLLFGLIYLTFNILFYIFGGTNSEGKRYVYPILDWSDPIITFLYVIPLFLTLAGGHFLIYALYKFRKLLHSKFGFQRFEMAPYEGCLVEMEREVSPETDL